MELYIYKGHIYQRIENDGSEHAIKLDTIGWVAACDLEPVSFSDIQRWYRSSVFELDVML